jgi:hypothetical protein
MKNLLLFVVFVAGLLGIGYLIHNNWHMFSNLRMPQTNIRMPSVGH